LAKAIGETRPYARLGALDDVVRWHPYEATAWRQRARARLEWTAAKSVFASQRMEGAAADLDAALRLRPLWSEAWADLGWVRWRQGDTAGARVAFERARGLDPTHRSMSLAFQRFLEGIGAREEAEAEAARLRRLSPEWATAPRSQGP
jgi:Flp pilus assembly protein TadD